MTYLKLNKFKGLLWYFYET